MEVLQFFANPSLAGICFALIFGILWLAALGVWQWQGKWLWLVLAGVVLFPVSIGLFQSPLQSLVGNLLINNYGVQAYQEGLLYMGIPVVLLSGLVQEGAKLLPTSLWWWGQNRRLSPETGLAIGAVVGAGFGVCEAQWVLNMVFNAGFTWDYFAIYGLDAIWSFWERFFTVAFHIATGALTGYGLAKGKGWQFYLIASFIHFFSNYFAFVYYKGLITVLQIEIIIAVIALAVFGFVLWLRWRRVPEQTIS